MKLSLEKGLSMKIEGELGKYQTLPIEALIKISQSFQHLVQSIARLEIQTEGGIDLDNFKIEISDFKQSSAVPVFVLTPRIKYTTGNDVEMQRSFVSERVDKIFSIANSGNYLELKKEYPEAYKRNKIVEDLYNFTSSFGNAPVSFGSITQGNKFKKIYQLNKFKDPIKKALITEIKEPKKEESVYVSNAVGNLQVKRVDGKIKVKVTSLFEDQHADLSFVTDTIVHGDYVFELNAPLRCRLSKEDNYYLIESELLDIVGTGETEDEAEKSFSEEFFYIHKRYNELDNKQLSPRLQKIKSLLEILIKKVTV